MRLQFPKITIPTTYAPFGGDTGDFDFILEGENLTSPSAAAVLISFADRQGGTPIAGLTLSVGSGISLTWDAAYTDDAGAVVGATTIRGTIAESALEAISWGQIEPDQPLNLWCDVLITPSGGAQQYLCDGPIEVIKGIGD